MVAILIPKWAALHHACSTVLLVAGGRVSGEIELAKICEVMLAPFVVDKTFNIRFWHWHRGSIIGISMGCMETPS